jgi:hypothetical protein
VDLRLFANTPTLPSRRWSNRYTERAHGGVRDCPGQKIQRQQPRWTRCRSATGSTTTEAERDADATKHDAPKLSPKLNPVLSSVVVNVEHTVVAPPADVAQAVPGAGSGEFVSGFTSVSDVVYVCHVRAQRGSQVIVIPRRTSCASSGASPSSAPRLSPRTACT